ncbi:MAG: Txe/YoeB family addiction module toxin [Clostridia bacterium]|nr:Txe/YoeB family addiction module toxin [Clostridia bacterium]
MYTIEYHKRALKDIQKLKQNNLENKAKQLVDLIKKNPFQNPPPYEKLIGDLSGLYSRRINIQHRLVYQVLEDKKTVRLLSLWSHYENI